MTILSHIKPPASGISPDSRRAEGQPRRDSMYIKTHTLFWSENTWASNVFNKYCYGIPVFQLLLYTEYRKKTQNSVVCYRINLSHVTTPASQTTNIFFSKIYSQNIAATSVPTFLLLIRLLLDQKQLENVECFKYLGSMLTNDGRCTCGIKSRIAMAKAAFKRRRLFLPANWT